jgi:glycosyltransferase involved in cell wall biosynthesis
MTAISLKEQDTTRQEAATATKPMVSVVVPAFNESAIIQDTLATLCDYMQGLEDEYSWEIVVVNDGSTDTTGDLLEEFARDWVNIKVLHHMFNFRLGQALRYAFGNCSGDYIVVMDSDLSYSPDHIGRMLEKIRETRAKIVIASPYMKEGKVSNVPFARKFLSVWANRFIAFFARDRFQQKLTTITGMVRAYDSRFLSKLNLKAMDTDINPEIIYKAMILRARIVEVPAHLKWSDDKGEQAEGQKSKPKRRGSSMRIMRSILSSVLSGFMFRPFMFFILPGLLILLLSLYTLAWSLIHTFSALVSTEGLDFSEAVAQAYLISPHSFIVGGFTLLISFQLFSLGIIALQNKKYFEELFHLHSSK